MKNPLKERRKSENKSTWKEQEKCLFLQLPGELRNHIYNLVFPRSDDPSDNDYYTDLKTVQRPGLTATCRQIKHETLPIFFHNTRFLLAITVDNDWHLQKPLVSRSTAAWIKHVNGQIRQLRCCVSQPPIGSHFAFAFDLIPRANPHFGTSWSLCLNRDHSDFPHCANSWMAYKWSSLARAGKTDPLKIEDVRGLVNHAVDVWVPGTHRWAMRHPRLRRQIKKMIPKWFYCDYGEKVCKCQKCLDKEWQEKREAKKKARAE